MREVMQKLAAMSDGDLRTVWRSLENYDPDEYYDAEKGIKMDEWANAVYSELSSRGLLAI
jgi:hypothetical protein